LVKDKREKVGAVIVAAGSGERMEGIDKVLALLDGEPVLLRATRPFQNSHLIDQIVVVVSGEREATCRQLVTGKEWSKVTDICLGGERRQDSVLAGLGHLKDCRWAIIHDAARPLVAEELIEKGLEAARDTGSAVAAVPVTDTIKMAGEDMLVQGTPPRGNLWAVQTPQVFRFDIIAEAFRKVDYEVTDDSRLVEQLGYKVKLYMGSYDNIKITTPRDLDVAETLWQKRSGRAG
jgi:2-C-methyl-D-erythritol 4-phosphate cytidylyltransferase